MPDCKRNTQQTITLTVAGLCLIFLTTLGLMGCGGDEEKSSADTLGKSPAVGKSPSLDSDKKPKTFPQEDAESLVTGVVKITGSAPKLKLLVEKGSEVQDAKVCSVQAIPDESLVINSENHGVANVFVFLGRAPHGMKTRIPKTPVVIDQKGCRFFPHALLVQTSQTLNAISSDDVAHNIHTFSLRNDSINSIVQPNDQIGLDIDLRFPESQPFMVKCDLHPWMTAYVLALDHPFMAVTDENGKFEIKGLPVGTHQLKIWHEKVGYLEKKYEATIEKGTPTEIELEYTGDKFADKETSANP